jgi:ATP-dependent Clp protease adaptor protein ClpS
MSNKKSNQNSSTPVLERVTELTPIKPQKYEVLFHNDDFTPMEFVVAVLKEVFGHSHQKAFKIMMDVHECGEAICGVYIEEVAAARVDLVKQIAEENEYPLHVSMRPEGSGLIPSTTGKKPKV